MSGTEQMRFAPRVRAMTIAEAIDPQRPPTREQEAMIEQPFGPLLVVAGAGAGKTETMSQRVLFAVANGVAAPAEVLGLTFTRKAAGELSERVRHRLRTLRASGLWHPAPGLAASPGADTVAAGRAVETGWAGQNPGVARPLDADRPRITTYNAFAGELVAEFALRLGEDPTASLMTDARRWQLAEEVVTTWPEDLPTENAPSTVIDAVLALSGALDEHLLTPAEAAEQLEDTAEGFTIVKKNVKPHPVGEALRARAALMPLVAAFHARAAEEGLIDFGGQVALAVRIAREVPEVREIMRARFPVVMLDEYQDTSVAQVALLSALFGDGHGVTAVGDPQQAIYGWRGASAGAMGQFHDRFRSAGYDPRTLSLATSWRNDEAILAVANEVARGAGDPGSRPPTLAARPGAGPGRVLHHRAEDLDAEVAAIADHLAATWNVEYRAWVEAGGAASSEERPATRSAAILCRRRALFRPIVEALEERGVPHRVVGLGGLLQQPEVADIRALLTVVARPERGDAAVHLLHRLRLGAKDLAALHAQARSAVAESVAALTGDADRRTRVDVRDEATLAEVLSRPTSRGAVEHPGTGELGRYDLSPEAHTRLAHLLGVLDELRRRRTLPLGELVVLAERLLGLDVEVAARADRGARAAIDAFVHEATRFAADAPGAQLASFLDWLDRLESHERVDLPEEDISGVDTEVLVMTIHAAKGLEWDVVAVPELNEGRLPAYASTPAEDGSASDSAWLTGLDSLPYAMRGDAEDLPQFGGADGVPALTGDWATKKELDEAIAQYKELCGRHAVREARNLAYVAVTRARSELLLTSNRSPRRGAELPESRFVVARSSTTGRPLLEELDATPAASPRGNDEPAPAWPADPLTPRRRAVLDRVAAAMERGGADPDTRDRADASGRSDTAAQWWREAELLLAERAAREAAERPGAGPEALAGLPGKFSVTTLVNILKNPAYAARNVLRPIPRPPSYATSRGTSLHEWIEQHYRAATLTEGVEATGDADGATPGGARPDVDVSLAGTGSGQGEVEGDVSADMLRLREAFARGAWAQRSPVAIEVELAIQVDGIHVPGKADAVFDDAHGCAVVDWKTTAVPRGADLERVGLQLHVYRLAWARRTGRPIEEIAGYFVHLKESAAEPIEVELPRLGEDEVLARMRESLAAVRAEMTTLTTRAATARAEDADARATQFPADWEEDKPRDVGPNYDQ